MSDDTPPDAEPWTEKWVKIESLGGGGQGDTILVNSLSGEFDRAVLKLLKPRKAKDAKARRRMAQEVTNLKVLRNAGGKVPQVLAGNTEEFEDPNVPLYFVMEYISGKTLAETVESAKGISLSAAVAVALDLCTTMQVAIKEGIVHRDIKPENIIVRKLEPADVVMVDFGLSFNEDNDLKLTEADEALDNKFISLPERRGPGENKRDSRSDLTGICVILFYCLTGCAPRNLSDSQGRPPHRWPGYPLSNTVQNELQRDALDLFFNRGLNYEIDFRFQTIDELISRLKELLNPSTTQIPEDMETVVAREVAALRKSDRRTQIAEYAANVQTLRQSYDLCCNDIARKLGNQNKFRFGWMGMTMANAQVFEGGEVIAFTIATLSVENHSVTFQIRHTFVAQGSECTVYRDILDGPPNSSQQKIADQSAVVLRYKGETTPSAGFLVADFKAGVTKGITLISRKILSGK
jgi:serine/threonine protein kinase